MSDPVGDLAKLADRAIRQAGDAHKRVGEVELLIRQLAADVVALRDIAQSRADADDARAVRSWLQTTDPDSARRILDDLVGWVDQVYLAYHGVILRSCWLWHPSVVEELVTLREAHHDAYAGPGAGWKAASDWHERYRPGVAKRVGAALSGCDLARHLPGAERHAVARLAPLTAAVGAVAKAWATGRGTPVPTDEQIKEAERHDNPRSHKAASTRSGGR